ncbi:hypothetical protein EVAR_9119_1 [Eumeta japonica]|uniref:Uncharacterized protein n=1 Tax=Eumeta variegata TaxID=151549 RepID=A0A4C1TXB7_EUMVA|nr:hypothetical protein EVAR_9119_1 [Eumeta japonica]
MGKPIRKGYGNAKTYFVNTGKEGGEKDNAIPKLEKRDSSGAARGGRRTDRNEVELFFNNLIELAFAPGFACV